MDTELATRQKAKGCIRRTDVGLAGCFKWSSARVSLKTTTVYTTLCLKKNIPDVFSYNSRGHCRNLTSLTYRQTDRHMHRDRHTNRQTHTGTDRETQIDRQRDTAVKQSHDLIPEKQCNTSRTVCRPDCEEEQSREDIKSLSSDCPTFSYQ